MSKKGTKKAEQTLGFEAAMNELEALVDSMETEPFTLEESLKKFEKGVQLTRLCQQALSKVEQDIKLLTNSDEEVDFSVDANKSGSKNG